MDHIITNPSDGNNVLAPNLNGQSYIDPTPAGPAMQNTMPTNDNVTTMNNALNS